MDEHSQTPDLRSLTRTAERLDSLAEVAELMGDGEGASRFRELASDLCQQGLGMLDDPEEHT